MERRTAEPWLSLFSKENFIKLLLLIFSAGVLYSRLDGMDTRIKRIENLVDYLAQKELGK